MIKRFIAIFVIFAVTLFTLTTISAQVELPGNTLKIIDFNIDSGGGVATGNGNLDLLLSTGNPTADSRLESANYALNSGFPSNFQANVPLIRCVESNTTSATTDCLNFPNLNGAQGECGTPGCYDRVKVEIDPQNNPVDTLYLVSFTDTSDSTTYYLTTSHTLSTAPPSISGNYMTICQLEGKDTRSGSGCATNADPEWDEALQSSNVYGLRPGATYEVRARAISGDFSETQFSPPESVTLEYPTLSFDIDIDGISGFSTENASPYSIALGELSTASPTTAADRIWLDMNANINPGIQVYVKDLNGGLIYGGNLIPSQSEDLDLDSGDGGFGLKIETATQVSLGPIISAPTYSTANPNQVGALGAGNTLIFETNTTGSNVGPVTNGRASLAVKAIQPLAAAAGVYSDTITFTMLANL
ncbi:MAG: hypothetical protein Kow0081_4400 [Candidatus Dojkabacteria bacterium]